MIRRLLSRIFPRFVAVSYQPAKRPTIDNDIHRRLMAETGLKGPKRRYL